MPDVEKDYMEKIMATTAKSTAKNTSSGTSSKKSDKGKSKNTKKPGADSKRKPAAVKSQAPTSKDGRAKSATALLRADHKLVRSLFEDFEAARSPAKKKKIVAKICNELTVHAQIEEEIFYPAVKEALDDHELVPEAHVEHEAVKRLIAEVEGAEPDGEMYDAKVKVMSEFVKHHVKEEQTQMFKEAKKSGLDMRELGAKLQARKKELLAARA